MRFITDLFVFNTDLPCAFVLATFEVHLQQKTMTKEKELTFTMRNACDSTPMQCMQQFQNNQLYDQVQKEQIKNFCCTIYCPEWKICSDIFSGCILHVCLSNYRPTAKFYFSQNVIEFAVTFLFYLITILYRD